MTGWHVAGVSRDIVSVIDANTLVPIFIEDIGVDILGSLEGVTDFLSDRGWEQTTPWHVNAVTRAITGAGEVWNCEVTKIVENDNDRRADLALALSQEDEREGLSRPIRPRVESALEFESMIRDRKDGFPSV